MRRLVSASQRIVALDGGVNQLKKLDIAPQVVIGDLDSADTDALSWARGRKARILRISTQESSDFQKGLAYCREIGAKSVVVCGVCGTRLDHLLSALSATQEFPDLDLTIHTGQATVTVLNGTVSRDFALRVAQTVSWIPVTRTRGCRLSGVRWPLRNVTLEPGGFHSLSNVVTESTVTVTQRSGLSLLIVDVSRRRPR